MRAALAVTLLACAPAYAQSRAPLGLRTQGPLRELFLDVTSADARHTVAAELDVRYSMANTWNERMSLVSGGIVEAQELDEQADSLAVRFKVPWSRALGPRWRMFSTAIEGRLTMHWGGYTDRAIEAWHSLVGAFNYRRSLNPRNEVHLLFADERGTAFDIRGTTMAFGDIALRNQLTLLEAGEPLSDSAARYGLALRLDLKLPTGRLSQAGGSGGFDAGIGVLGTAEMTSWLTLHGLVALSKFSGLSASTALQPKPWHFTAELSAAASWGETTFLLEDRVLSPLFPAGWTRLAQWGDDGLLSSGLYADFRAHNQVSFAVRRGGLTVWLSEDVTPGHNEHSVVTWLWMSNAPDVVLGVAYSKTF